MSALLATTELGTLLNVMPHVPPHTLLMRLPLRFVVRFAILLKEQALQAEHASIALSVECKLAHLQVQIKSSWQAVQDHLFLHMISQHATLAISISIYWAVSVIHVTLPWLDANLVMLFHPTLCAKNAMEACNWSTDLANAQLWSTIIWLLQETSVHILAMTAKIKSRTAVDAPQMA